MGSVHVEPVRSRYPSVQPPSCAGVGTSCQRELLPPSIVPSASQSPGTLDPGLLFSVIDEVAQREVI